MADQLKLTKCPPITLYAGSLVMIYHALQKDLKAINDGLAQAAKEDAENVAQLSPESALRKDKAREVLEVSKFFVEHALKTIEPEFKKLTPDDL